MNKNKENTEVEAIDENPEYIKEAQVVDMVSINSDELEYLKITLDTLTEMFKDLNYKIMKLEEYNTEREEAERVAEVSKMLKVSG